MPLIWLPPEDELTRALRGFGGAPDRLPLEHMRISALGRSMGVVEVVYIGPDGRPHNTSGVPFGSGTMAPFEIFNGIPCLNWNSGNGTSRVRADCPTLKLPVNNFTAITRYARENTGSGAWMLNSATSVWAAQFQLEIDGATYTADDASSRKQVTTSIGTNYNKWVDGVFTTNPDTGDQYALEAFLGESFTSYTSTADDLNGNTFDGALFIGGSNANAPGVRLAHIVFFDRSLSSEQASFARLNLSRLVEPVNDSPFIVGTAAGGPPDYAETFTATSAAELALTNSWALNYSETFTATSAADLALTDAYDSPSVAYDETFTATSAAELALTDAWALGYAETLAASAAADLALTDAWALDFPETFTAAATADLVLADSYAVGNHYAESFSAGAVADLALTDVWVPNYAETLSAGATSDLALTDTWALDYAEVFAASAAADLALTDAYDTPAPGAFDETFSAAALADLDLTGAFTTPNALPSGITSLTAARLAGVKAQLIN